MKITLRKVKSSHLGEKYNPDFFKPIQLAPNISAISITNNLMGIGGIFYTIIRKYDLDYMQYILCNTYHPLKLYVAAQSQDCQSSNCTRLYY
jgi:hypothetical protein